MESLDKQFSDAWEQIRKSHAETISFPIGGEEKIYLADHRKPNGAYIENGVERALLLYDALPAAPRILKIDLSPGEDIQALAFLEKLHLPSPDLTSADALYWKIPPKPHFLRTLFREIIKSEISPDGLEELSGSVSFLDPDLPFLFRILDDRSAEVIIFSCPDSL